MGAKGSKPLTLDRDDHGSATNPAPNSQPASPTSPDPNPPADGHDHSDSAADPAPNPQPDTPQLPSRCVRKLIRLLYRLNDSYRKHNALIGRYFRLRNKHLDQLANAPFDLMECSRLWDLWEETNNALEELHRVRGQFSKDLKALAYCPEVKIKGIMRHRALRPRWKEFKALIEATEDTLARHEAWRKSHIDDQNRGRVEDCGISGDRGMAEDVKYWSRMLRALRSHIVDRLRSIF